MQKDDAVNHAGADVPSTTLLGCPFCGGKAMRGISFGRFAILCSWCGAGLREKEICPDNYANIESAWNTRVECQPNPTLHRGEPANQGENHGNQP